MDGKDKHEFNLFSLKILKYLFKHKNDGAIKDICKFIKISKAIKIKF